jgi:ribosomal protein S18 acetylase RimI-like enzyme
MVAPLIRLALDADAQPIAMMSRCLIEVGLRGWSWDPARVTRAIRHRDTCVAVAEIDHRAIGFAIAEFGDTRMHLSLLAVAAAQQRSGVGRALVAWLEQSALTAGITEIQLELRANNVSAKIFYQALGFEFVRAVPGYYRGEETALKMQKTIGVRAAGSIK